MTKKPSIAYGESNEETGRTKPSVLNETLWAEERFVGISKKGRKTQTFVFNMNLLHLRLRVIAIPSTSYLGNAQVLKPPISQIHIC